MPKINVPFAAWTDLLILLEDNSQFSGILTALEGVCAVCGLIRGHLPARSRARRPRGLNGFLDLYPLLVRHVWARNETVGEHRFRNPPENQCDRSFPSPPKWAAKDYHSSNNAYRQLKNSRPSVKPLAPMGDFSFLFSHPLSSPSHQEQIKPCQHERWRTESALTTDGTNVMDASQALSSCAT